MATLRQLGLKGRILKRRRCIVAALKGAPQRKGIIMKIGTTTPKKPNSAKRKFAKVWVPYSKKIIYCHVPGIGRNFLQEYSNVLVEGGNPPDVPGINYTLVRGKKAYDFCIPEEFGRLRRRSKFGTFKTAILNESNPLKKYTDKEMNQARERIEKLKKIDIKLEKKVKRNYSYKDYLEKKKF